MHYSIYLLNRCWLSSESLKINDYFYSNTDLVTSLSETAMMRPDQQEELKLEETSDKEDRNMSSEAPLSDTSDPDQANDIDELLIPGYPVYFNYALPKATHALQVRTPLLSQNSMKPFSVFFKQFSAVLGSIFQFSCSFQFSCCFQFSMNVPAKLKTETAKLLPINCRKEENCEL